MKRFVRDHLAKPFFKAGDIYAGRLSEDERDLVLGLNAQRFWRLRAP